MGMYGLTYFITPKGGGGENVCALFSLGQMRLLKWSLSYTREGNQLVEYGIDISP